jgi:hypothetical protein
MDAFLTTCRMCCVAEFFPHVSFKRDHVRIGRYKCIRSTPIYFVLALLSRPPYLARQRHKPNVNSWPMSASLNRPFEVKRFQTIHHCNVDVARGLALLFGFAQAAISEPEAFEAMNRDVLNGGAPTPAGAISRLSLLMRQTMLMREWTAPVPHSALNT